MPWREGVICYSFDYIRRRILLDIGLERCLYIVYIRMWWNGIVGKKWREIDNDKGRVSVESIIYFWIDDYLISFLHKFWDTIYIWNKAWIKRWIRFFRICERNRWLPFKYVSRLFSWIDKFDKFICIYFMNGSIRNARYNVSIILRFNTFYYVI